MLVVGISLVKNINMWACHLEFLASAWHWAFHYWLPCLSYLLCSALFISLLASIPLLPAQLRFVHVGCHIFLYLPYSALFMSPAISPKTCLSTTCFALPAGISSASYLNCLLSLLALSGSCPILIVPTRIYLLNIHPCSTWCFSTNISANFCISLIFNELWYKSCMKYMLPN